MATRMQSARLISRAMRQSAGQASSASSSASRSTGLRGQANQSRPSMSNSGKSCGMSSSAPRSHLRSSAGAGTCVQLTRQVTLAVNPEPTAPVMLKLFLSKFEEFDDT